MPSPLNPLNFGPHQSTISYMNSSLIRTLFSVLATHRNLALENLALRQQIAVLQRSTKTKRPRLKQSDRLFWVLPSRVWKHWAGAWVVDPAPARNRPVKTRWLSEALHRTTGLTPVARALRIE